MVFEGNAHFTSLKQCMFVAKREDIERPYDVRGRDKKDRLRTNPHDGPFSCLDNMIEDIRLHLLHDGRGEVVLDARPD